MLVPKAAVDEDGPFPRPVRDVGRSGQVTIPNTETQPQRVEGLSDYELG
jgi:hypothetical protein